MLAFSQYKMTSMKILFAIISFLSLFSKVKLTTDVDIDSRVKYQDGQWSGKVACTFYNQADCLQSMHVNGRRIDTSASKRNEQVFVSCFSSTTSIALLIKHFTYEDIDDYSCLQDTTHLYNNAWLTPNPYIEVKGNQSAGSVVNLTCNSVPGAPLYWILPGKQQDNNQVQIIDTSNRINSSTTAIVRYDSHYNSEYKCCIRSKVGQFSTACSSYKFSANDPTVHLVSTSADFMNSKSLVMSCALQSNFYTPDQELMKWQQCTSSMSCTTTSSTFITTKVDDKAKTLNTTVKIAYSSSYPYYKCLYDWTTYHTFEVQLGARSPLVQQSSTEVYYSNNHHAVKLSCLILSNPQPTVTWAQTKLLEFSNGIEIITSGGVFDIDVIPISTTEWQTTLIINPYDVTVHNNIYTCIANNSVGQHSAQLSTNKGPANLDVKLMNNTKKSDTTNAIKAICAYKTFPNLPNFYINVISAETIQLTSQTFFWDPIVDAAMVEVAFEANVGQFPLTIECTAFNPFSSTSQVTDRIYIDSNSPIS